MQGSLRSLFVEESFLKISVNGESFALLNQGDGDLLLYYGLKGYTLGCDTTNAWSQNARLTRA